MNRYLIVGTVAILATAGGWWYFSQTPSVPAATSLEETAEVQQENVGVKNNVPVSSFKTVTTSNGFSFSIPASWQTKQTRTAGEPTSDGAISKSNVIALSNAQGIQIANVSCPSVIGYEEYEIVEHDSQSRTFSNEKGTSYQVSYKETQDYEHSKLQKNVERAAIIVRPSVLTTEEEGYLQIVAQACLVTASGPGYWSRGKGPFEPIDAADLAVIKDIFSSWSATD
ncbi:MAG: hypothetical protein QG636_145 [Patescibacteria group bacterium]|nr:hypothetical protein [Patescibacteria group bacterium]